MSGVIRLGMIVFDIFDGYLLIYILLQMLAPDLLIQRAALATNCLLDEKAYESYRLRLNVFPRSISE